MTMLARSRPYVELLHNQYICHRCGIQYETDHGRRSVTVATYCLDCRWFARNLGWAPKMAPQGAAKKRIEAMIARGDR